MDNTITKTAFDAAILDRVWLRLRQDDITAQRQAAETLGCRFPALSEGYDEDGAFIYLPVSPLVRRGDHVHQDTVYFAIGDDMLVTLEPDDGFPPFDRALASLRRRPELARSPHGVMYTLLSAMNSAANQIVELASNALDGMSEPIAEIMDGTDEKGRELGVGDIAEAMGQLNENEDLISRIQESQLLLERAARYLRNEVNGSDAELRLWIEALISDIQSVKEHAGFEHDKLRYLQNAVMTSLNVKQNQIVKVFTIITAVFLPPTLVATFYGMNFAVMPELAWKHGFPMTIILTLLAALLPLVYIKQKGWLR